MQLKTWPRGNVIVCLKAARRVAMALQLCALRVHDDQCDLIARTNAG